VTASLSDSLLADLGELVAQTMGLHFPRPRWPDLQRGLVAASESLGIGDAASFARKLLSAPLSIREAQALADALTVGETYFFREPSALDALSRDIIPRLRDARGAGRPRLRLWSAGCCTGEEPYSIAITLHRTLPDYSSWDIDIVATDLNSRFLDSARAGLFRDWSFRGSPDWLKAGYFRRTAAGQFEILPEIRRMVRFVHGNLAADAAPSMQSDGGGMDVIFCRNVLMYFEPSQARKAVGNLYRAQADGGWLITSASELPLVSAAPYAAVRSSDLMLHRKETGGDALSRAPVASPPPAARAPQPQRAAGAASRRVSASLAHMPRVRHEPLDAGARAAALCAQGRHFEAAGVLESALATRPHDAALLALLARCRADQRQLEPALASCDRWLAADRLNPAAHLLRAAVLHDHGRLDEAAQCSRRALYLDPGLVIAQVLLANIARSRGREREARRHFARALHLLQACSADDVVPESGGMTAASLVEILSAILAQERAA